MLSNIERCQKCSYHEFFTISWKFEIEIQFFKEFAKVKWPQFHAFNITNSFILWKWKEMPYSWVFLELKKLYLCQKSDDLRKYNSRSGDVMIKQRKLDRKFLVKFVINFMVFFYRFQDMCLEVLSIIETVIIRRFGERTPFSHTNITKLQRVVLMGAQHIEPSSWIIDRNQKNTSPFVLSLQTFKPQINSIHTNLLSFETTFFFCNCFPPFDLFITGCVFSINSFTSYFLCLFFFSLAPGKKRVTF